MCLIAIATPMLFHTCSEHQHFILNSMIAWAQHAKSRESCALQHKLNWITHSYYIQEKINYNKIVWNVMLNVIISEYLLAVLIESSFCMLCSRPQELVQIVSLVISIPSKTMSASRESIASVINCFNLQFPLSILALWHAYL